VHREAKATFARGRHSYNRGVWRHVPNTLTSVRLLLAGIFFVMLSWYQYEGRGHPTLLEWALAVYLVALATDYLDGYLARRWGAESAFGRIVDPLVDKILVLGSFAFFCGKNFVIQEGGVDGHARALVLHTITGVAPGVVVILLARELLVTSLRGSAESSGQKFGANLGGKLKMVVQSFTILVILLYVNYRQELRDAEWERAAILLRDACIWATVAITVISGMVYVRRAASMFRSARPAA
jgi:CDP-diacylglycerol---glycerol-3-phosphate 3-phosphatidyltransferase